MIIKENIILPAGVTRIVHVNRFVINSNTKREQDEPVCVVREGEKLYYGREIIFTGVTKLTQKECQISCGARVYHITDAQLEIIQ